MRFLGAFVALSLCWMSPGFAKQILAVRGGGAGTPAHFPGKYPKEQSTRQRQQPTSQPGPMKLLSEEHGMWEPTPFPHHAPAFSRRSSQSRSSNPCPAWCACAGTYSAYLDTGITRNPDPSLLSSQQPLPGCWHPTSATGLLTQSQHPEDPAHPRYRRHPPELGAKILSGAKTHSLLPLHKSLLQAESSGTGDAALSDSSATFWCWVLGA